VIEGISDRPESDRFHSIDVTIICVVMMSRGIPKVSIYSFTNAQGGTKPKNKVRPQRRWNKLNGEW
jgi:hypothetical protein